MLKVRGFCYTAMAYSFVFFKYTATFLDAKFTVKTKVIVQYWHRVYIILAYSMALPLHSPVFTDDLEVNAKSHWHVPLLIHFKGREAVWEEKKVTNHSAINKWHQH